MQVLLRQAASLGTSNTFFCLDARHTATAGFAGFSDAVWPVAGTFRNLVVYLATAPGVGEDRTLTLYVNGVASALTCTATGSTTTARDATTLVPVAAGDYLRMAFTNSAGSPATTNATWTLEFEPTEPINSGYTTNVATAVSGFVDVFTGRASATASDCARDIPCDGTITSLAGAQHFTSVGVGNALNVFVYLNGVKQDGTGGTVDTLLSITDVAQHEAVFATFDLPVERGDSIYLGLEEVGSYPSGWSSIAMAFSANVAGESIVVALAGGTPNSGVAGYHLLVSIGAGLANWTTVNGFGAQLRCGVSSISLGDLFFRASDDPGAGNTRTFEVMVDGSVPADTPQGIISTGVLTIDDNRTAFFTDGDLVGPMRHTPDSTPVVTGTEYWSLVMAAELPPPPGGGTNPDTHTNPTQGNLTTSLPIVFVTIRVLQTGEVLRYSQAEIGQLNDASDWYEGKKQGRILRFAPVRRKLAWNGAFEAYPFELELLDNDGVLRALARGRNLRGSFVECFVVDDAVRRAEGVAFRFAAGHITTHKGLIGMRYLLRVAGALGRKLSALNQESKIPTHLLNPAETPGVANGLAGQAAPVAIGALTDHSLTNPQGVIEGLYMGTGNLQTICGGGAVDVVVDAYLLTMGAAAEVRDLYYNPPEWGPEMPVSVGDLIRPADLTAFFYRATVAGTTDTSEPTWPVTVGGTVVDGTVTWRREFALDLSLRYVVPASAYGTVLLCPHKPNWTADTGLATNYVDFGTPTRRYTPVFVRTDHRLAKALRERRMSLTASLYGLTDTADGLGNVLTAPENQATFILTNQVFSQDDTWTTYGEVLDFPTVVSTPGYSMIDLDTFEAARLLSNSFLPGGYVGGFLLGRGGSQQKAFDVLREICIGTNLQLGENHHGQIIAHRHNPNSSPAVSYTALDDILAIDWDIDDELFHNITNLRYGYRYAPSLLPGAAADKQEWTSGLITLGNTPSVFTTDTLLRRPLDNYVTRDSSTAYDVALRLQALHSGYPATVIEGDVATDGALALSFTTRWQGVIKNGVEVDLGTTVSVQHPEFVIDLPVRVTVHEQVIEPLKGLVTNIGYMLEL